VIVDNLNIFGISCHPTEAQAELVVDSNAVLALAVPGQCFEPVAWRRA
jgi:hypothetical protein